MTREPLTSTHTSRVSSALTARDRASRVGEPFPAGTESLDRKLRQLAGGEQTVDAVIAREAANLAMTFVGEAPELTHVAHHQPAPRVDAREHLDPALIELGLAL